MPVDLVPQQPDLGEMSAHHLARAVNGGVVDDNDLVGFLRRILRNRTQAIRKELARVVGRDDDREHDLSRYPYPIPTTAVGRPVAPSTIANPSPGKYCFPNALGRCDVDPAFQRNRDPRVSCPKDPRWPAKPLLVNNGPMPGGIGCALWYAVRRKRGGRSHNVSSTMADLP